MTTDNRTNEQIVAEVLDEERYYDPDQISNSERAGDIISALRAAGRLVAAQEAAPQAESEPKPHTRVVTRSFDSDCALGICMSGCSHLMWVCDSCSSEGGWGAARGQLKKWAADHVCPVLPSSGVDEDAMAEVIRKLRFDDPGCWADGIDCTESVSDHADVIEKVREQSERPFNEWIDIGAQIGAVLDTAPADALREHDAALIESLADEMLNQITTAGYGEYVLVDNAVDWLNDQAQKRREGSE